MFGDCYCLGYCVGVGLFVVVGFDVVGVGVVGIGGRNVDFVGD